TRPVIFWIRSRCWDMSAMMKSCSCPGPRCSSPCAASSEAALRARRVTLAPIFERRMAEALPMPLLLPQTRAFFPVRLISMAMNCLAKVGLAGMGSRQTVTHSFKGSVRVDFLLQTCCHHISHSVADHGRLAFRSLSAKWNDILSNALRRSRMGVYQVYQVNQ